MKTALGLMGMSQLSLTKCIILVSEGVDVRKFSDVLREVRSNFDPHFDFVMIPVSPRHARLYERHDEPGEQDDNRRDEEGPCPGTASGNGRRGIPLLRPVDRRIVDQNLIDDAMLIVTVRRDGMQVLRKLLKHPSLAALP